MPGSELIIGLIGAVGTDLNSVQRYLEHELHEVGYTSEPIRLSGLLTDCHRYSVHQILKGGPEGKRIEQLMTCGDDLRVTSGRGDAVALLAISKIKGIRQEKTGDDRTPVKRHCFVLNSLKHPKEISTLREVYGDSFVAVAVYTPKAQRRETLSTLITRTSGGFDATPFASEADQLIKRDEKATDEPLGQNVRDTFPEADVFLDASPNQHTAGQVKRFIEILFRHPNRTPTVDESGLFHAKAAALRSSDLSRQVGAVIATKAGELIAAGCNDVPGAGGSVYWEGQKEGRDRRDFTLGFDSSAKMKRELLEEVFKELQEGGWLSPEMTALSPKLLVDKALFDPQDPILADTRVASILEFGRVVHAEMSALTESARRGISVRGATLYCTTFPCHMCARHIIASGVDRVVYVEPYPKSLAKDLYEGLIDVDHDPNADDSAVEFRPFFGVSPKRYLDFFQMPPRKDAQGFALKWIPREASPRVKSFERYLDAETALVERLEINKVEWGLVEPGKMDE